MLTVLPEQCCHLCCCVHWCCCYSCVSHVPADPWFTHWLTATRGSLHLTHCVRAPTHFTLLLTSNYGLTSSRPRRSRIPLIIPPSITGYSARCNLLVVSVSICCWKRKTGRIDDRKIGHWRRRLKDGDAWFPSIIQRLSVHHSTRLWLNKPGGVVLSTR